MGWVVLLSSAALGAGLFYWLVISTEGAYLGRRAVAYLYDRGASTYDQVKEFDAVQDGWDLAVPLQRALRDVKKPLVLDVATGTGRVPLALLRCLDFDGRIVGLDISLKMLQEARRKTAGHHDRVTLVWKDALALPFRDSAFDAVSCVEALEFMPDPRLCLQEMVRVLRSGGTLLVTNRIGFDAFLMPGRTFSNKQIEEFLPSLGCSSVEIKRWQTYYDIVWARKEGDLSPRERTEEPLDVLCCPDCIGSSLVLGVPGLSCQGCGSSYLIEKGIICLEGSLHK